MCALVNWGCTGLEPVELWLALKVVNQRVTTVAEFAFAFYVITSKRWPNTAVGPPFRPGGGGKGVGGIGGDELQANVVKNASKLHKTGFYPLNMPLVGVFID